MRKATGVLLAVLMGIWGCASMITDPMDRRGHFEDTHTDFTQYIRWGKFEDASRFVDPELREEFMSCSPEQSDLRFSDYQINRVDMDEEFTSASVAVRYTAYRLGYPVERSVELTEEWTRDETTGVWTVKLDVEKLRNTMYGAP
jgi:hypothetical protein